MELQLQNVVVEMVIIYELTVKHVVVSRENIVTGSYLYVILKKYHNKIILGLILE